MPSLFKRYMLSYGLLVIVSFSLLGGAFLYQVNQLSVAEKKKTLEDTIDKTVQSTFSYLEARRQLPSYLAQQALEDTYRINLMQLASYSGANIYITDSTGLIQRLTIPGATYDGDGSFVPNTAVQALLRTGSYTDVGNFSGFLRAPHFTTGSTVTNSRGEVYYLVFVSVPAQTSFLFLQNMVQIFWGFLIIVIICTLIATYLIVRQTLKPIQDMSRSAQVFARGDFSARLDLPKNHDELYTLVLNFNNMADEISKSEEERRGLIANVSHDLRTPMTTISGFVDGILDGAIPVENQDKYLHIISEEVKRLARLANDMVELSRFQSGAIDLNYTTFDLSEIVCRVIFSFEQKINEKNIEVEMDIPDTLMVAADRDAVFRVVYNLTDNAVKFTEQNGKMTFSIKQTGGRVVVSVENSGEPIPPNEARNVFERFYKLDKSRTESRNGAGLGLYIAKTIVNKHGGDIFATSLPHSTRFTFDLPLKVNRNK